TDGPAPVGTVAPVQQFVRELLLTPPVLSCLPARLADLARAFQVESAGVAVTLGAAHLLREWRTAQGVPIDCEPLPLDGRPDLGVEAMRQPHALDAVMTDGRRLLVTGLRQAGEANWLLWLTDAQERRWSPEDGANLTLALLALQRGLS